MIFRSRGGRAVPDVWWFQWVVGLAVVGLSLLPWLTGGSEIRAENLGVPARIPSLLPHAVLQPAYLLSLLFFSSLPAGFIARTLGRRGLKISLMLGTGLLCGWLGAAYQSWTVLAPYEALDAATRVHLWFVVVGGIAALLIYWVLARLDLAWVSICLALVSFAPGIWLAALFHASRNQELAGFAGPIALGVVLGFLGFARVRSLLLWCAALLLQWLVPAVLPAMEAGLREHGQSKGWAALWNLTMQEALQMRQVYFGLATLAAAMLVSVSLLVIRRARGR